MQCAAIVSSDAPLLGGWLSATAFLPDRCRRPVLLFRSAGQGRLSLKAVLGDHLAKTPIGSNESMIGRTLSAAGAVKAVFSLLTIRTGLVPPTINYRNPDPDIPMDVVPDEARRASIRTVLSSSFGFGGQNASLILAAP